MSVTTWPILTRRIDLVDSSIGITVDPDAIPIYERLLVIAFLSMAAYNAVELVFIVLFTFRRHAGLYFWSMMVSTVGVFVNAFAFVVNDFGLTPHRIVPALMIILGWIAMTTGQAFVLYSRLHLLSLYPRQLRLLLGMIITNAVVGHLPTSVFIIGSNSSSPKLFLVPYSIYEKVEVTLFFLQEMILSGIYLWKCLGFWRTQRIQNNNRVRAIVLHLIGVNLLIIALDVTILVLEYSGYYLIQTSYKPFVYSVKLKVEITILNRLVDFVRTTRRSPRQERYHATQQLEQEWVSTLERTVGTGHRDVLPPEAGIAPVGTGLPLETTTNMFRLPSDLRHSFSELRQVHVTWR